MNREDFRSQAAGRLVTTAAGHPAFVPAPLPPTLVYSADLVRALSRADAALSELSGLGRQLPNPHLLINPYLRREAVLSSRIEGTQASLSDLLMDEVSAEEVKTNADDVQEVRNYVIALEHGLQRLATLPLSLRLVRELHERLMQGVRGEHATRGEFRRRQNWIGPLNCTEQTASYVPPPVPEMHECLNQWEVFLHERDTLPELIQCALMHEQFEAIHPFIDGNGRLGRLLITLFLIERQRLSQPLLYLSDFIERTKREYYERLQAVRTDGDWTGWLLYFLEGVTQMGRKGVSQARRLTDLRDRLREKVGTAPRALMLVDALFHNPFISVTRAEKLLGVTAPTARNAVQALERAGIVAEITGRSWRRLYLSRPILDVIEGGDEQSPT
ncbi:MAG: Fic family protein [Panacagrimonas sp.]